MCIVTHYNKYYRKLLLLQILMPIHFFARDIFPALIRPINNVPAYATFGLPDSKHYICAMNAKTPKESHTIMNELVLPNDTNTLNNLMGGRLLHWMDIAAAIAAQKHCNRIVVTASVDNVSFKHSIKLGDVVTIEAKVSRAFNTSVEVRLDVWAENIPSGTRIKSNEAYYTFVALDHNNHTVPVPELIPESIEDMVLFEGALRRRQLRLILAGKMKPDDATELKALFFGEEEGK
ncbi:acyl-CoA thioesterase [Mucilaginibacter xinganensis]|uniref:Acyl-CoA thioesterase n=2 Tax=Mucilaginibacter xinganensis TaxID=1234841 RepID=A0A223NUU1_9SPHI|nr:acyl-CoA thioesterase [Mucilaginibacter xinganensis]